MAVPLFALGIGPQRTGSTWLDAMLRSHPRLCFPKDVKETMFFDRHYTRGVEAYTRHFQHDPDGRRIEIAPTYFDVPEVPARVHAFSPDCRIIVTLRHPVERAVSLHGHHLRKGRVPASFDEAVAQMPRILSAGDYADHLSRWLEAFTRVHIVLLDDIEAEPQSALASVAQFLDIEAPVLDGQTGARVNARSAPRYPFLAKWAARAVTALHDLGLHRVVQWGKQVGLHRVYQGGKAVAPTLSPKTQQILQERYEPHIAYVEALLGRDLSAWRAPLPLVSPSAVPVAE